MGWREASREGGEEGGGDVDGLMDGGGLAVVPPLRRRKAGMKDETSTELKRLMDARGAEVGRVEILGDRGG